MRKVIIESPFMGNANHTREEHIEYARKVVRDALLRGETPIASHLLLTQPGILDDDVPEQRKMGIEAGLDWMEVADASVFYTDYGWSSGMLGALKRCKERADVSNYTFEYRSLFGLSHIILPPEDDK